MNASNTPFLIGIAVTALVAGAIGGYFYANPGGSYTNGFNAGVTQGHLEAREEANRVAAEVAKNAAEVANPFNETTVNPFEEGYKNPFGEVKTNPFE